MPNKTRTPNERAAWSLNRIVRSDSRVGSYDKLAKSVLNPGNIRTASAPVQFGECGKVVSLLEEDAKGIPAIMSNSIDLSQVLGVEKQASRGVKLQRLGERMDPVFGIRTATGEFSEEQDEKSSPDEILDAISSLASKAVRRPDGTINRTASRLLEDLVSQLALPQRQEEWLTSQVKSGLLDERVFVRNVRHSMKAKGGAD